MRGRKWPRFPVAKKDTRDWFPWLIPSAERCKNVQFDPQFHPSVCIHKNSLSFFLIFFFFSSYLSLSFSPVFVCFGDILLLSCFNNRWASRRIWRRDAHKTPEWWTPQQLDTQWYFSNYRVKRICPSKLWEITKFARLRPMRLLKSNQCKISNRVVLITS